MRQDEKYKSVRTVQLLFSSPTTEFIGTRTRTSTRSGILLVDLD